jgi:integrase
MAIRSNGAAAGADLSPRRLLSAPRDNPNCDAARHACEFKLANDGHDTHAIQPYLGHRSIMSTVRYTALKPHRFKNF